MERRDFLKLSVLVSAALALESNSILRNALELTDSNSVMLYLLQNKDGKWKIRWTKYTQITKNKITPSKVNIETFKILEIVPESIAEKRRRELWKIYECSGNSGTTVGVKRTTASGKRLAVHPNTLVYRGSELNLEHLKKAASLGGKAIGPVQGKRNVESGLWSRINKESGQRVKELFKQEEFRKRVIPKLIEAGKRSGISNKEKGNLKSASEGGICAQGHVDTNRKRWKEIMDKLPHEFRTSDLVNVSSEKIQKNIYYRTDWLTRTSWGFYKKTPAFYDYKFY